MGLEVSLESLALVSSTRGRAMIRRRRLRARSLVKQFVELLSVDMGRASAAITDTGGVSRTISADQGILNAGAPSGTTSYGIVIGTGTNPVTMTDYKLQNQVTSNISHGVVTVAVENPSVNVWRIRISRVFVNNTGSVLEIKEVGLYVASGVPSYFFCADRSLYPFNISAGASRTLTYRITVTL